MVGRFSQINTYEDYTPQTRIIRKKIWRNEEWQDLTRYQIQIRADSSSNEIIAWLADTYGDESSKWTYNWGSLTMDEDVYTMFKLRWS